MTSCPFPVADATISFWRANDLHPLDSHRSSEPLPSEADVVVIGAGYAGTSVVHHLLENEDFVKKSPSIVILEAREACSGATGRNGGHLKAGKMYLTVFYAVHAHVLVVNSRSI